MDSSKEIRKQAMRRKAIRYEQFRRIKYSLIHKRPEQLEANFEEYNKLFDFMRKTAMELNGEKEGELRKPVVDPEKILALKNRTRLFIITNCPNYKKRLK